MKFYKKVAVLLLIIPLFFSAFNISYGDENFDIKAKSSILIDYHTGEIIYEKNAHEKLPPASVTKIMTLLLTMEAIDKGKIGLKDEVIISTNASKMGGSQIYLEEGESQTVEDLIRAICLRSANDASVALAEYIAGSEELFVKAMNERSKELKMNDTNFENSTGLPHQSHYTSAYDIALMSKELMKHAKIQEWLTIYMSDMKVGKKKDIVQSLVNTNRLIKDYQGANGIKTGSTSDAKYCLSASAKRGNLQLIAVIMGAETSKVRFEESKKLLDYGFANYDSVVIGKKGDIIGKVPINKGDKTHLEVVLKDDSYILIPKGSSGKAEKEIILPEVLNAPIEKGKEVGELILKIDGKSVDRVKLIAKETVDKAGFVNMFKKVVKGLLTNK
ncbi:MAG: D-alanyl-D-alanine carboxypeptidase [Tissierellaceae bacterium]|jgi:D-alanyl-D-alanine carboxypeptidase (penicillin-binding protein 5/6)|nr:D-alanyl-D-alanine carboxypeptidase [Tissierellaceae bacterium]